MCGIHKHLKFLSYVLEYAFRCRLYMANDTGFPLIAVIENIFE